MAMPDSTPVADALMIIASDRRRGAETFAVNLSNALRSHGHGSTVVALSGEGDPDSLRVERAGRSRWDPSGLARLVMSARRHDVVVGHGSSALLGGSIVAALARRPFVYRNIGDPTAWGDRRGATFRIGAPLRSAAAVAALYDVAGGELIRRYRLDSHRVRTIPNAASVDRFVVTTPAARSSARRSVDLDERLTWLGCVGALSEEKQVSVAIDLVGRNPGLGLVLAGEGPERANLERRAAERAPGRVVFLGSVGDVGRVYDSLDVLYLPSRTEGLPAVAIEAGLCGLPVIAAPVGGLPEIVVDGVTGVLVDPHDLDAVAESVAAVLAQRVSMGAAARRRVEERYSMTRVAHAWSALLEDVVSGRAGGRSTPGM